MQINGGVHAASTEQTRAADPLPMDDARARFAEYPYRVSQLMSGRPIAPSRSLFRPAGLTVPSAQAMRRLVPEEVESYRELGRLAGIPDDDAATRCSLLRQERTQ